MSSRRHGAPLLRGALSIGLAHRRAEEAVAALSAGWPGGLPPEPVPASPISTPPSIASGGDDVVAQLSQLVELAERGVLTTQEFAAAKARVLRHEQWW
ncbi:SHOCT domain-containing protein [Planosporangium flavigriseum]|uniref:Short C-terminal domain-containing protein n=1 Tax=Planosporangium flavigriseum TaxID=373681 RepID=A0A8J3M132_9ACTN|nr:SHOCT domain-containing protein [Planosporangium flavigriseum]NJC65614.1 SHOCT domain-containing protein [Planosporangium flavigriseum]GIG74775.1 hypothetical protein Pfl04_31790 [Planosporangium flavigriseum]